MYPHVGIKEPGEDLALSLSLERETQTNRRGHQAGTACVAYHRALRTAVLEAAGRFFVEAVVRS